MKRRILKILAVWLLTIFVGNYVYVAMSSHTHYLEGEVITHAHPFTSGHNHTTAEYSLLQSVYSAVYVSTPDFEDGICEEFRYVEVCYPEIEREGEDGAYDYSSLRGPPFV